EVDALESAAAKGLVLMRIKPAGKEFPITLAQVKKELGPPSASGNDSVDYQDKLKVSVSRALPPAFPEPWMELLVRPAGVELATKLFKSKVFTAAEGTAITKLLVKGFA